MPQDATSLLLSVFDSDLGWMALVCSPAGVRWLAFGQESELAARRKAYAECGTDLEEPEDLPALAARLQAFAAGEPVDFADVKLDLGPRTTFQEQVLRHCRRIKFGRKLSYAQLAEKAGSPRAARAVGNIMRSNRVPLIVPCHRVVGAGDTLGGYSAPGGLQTKVRLLELEQRAPQQRQRARATRT